MKKLSLLLIIVHAAIWLPCFSQQSNSRNTVAILPFRFIADDRETLDEGGYQAQDEAFTYLLNKIKSDFSIQSLQETNAILLRENITIDNYRMYTAQDFCRILGVDLILSGNVSQVRTSSTSTENSHTSVDNNNKKPGSNQGSSINTHGSSSSRENYSNTVKIELTDASGNVSFSQSHKAFAGSSSQTYRKAIRYLLKRSPLMK